MKTKMQFKGYVNGTEYSDPQAYNDALQKAIDDGTLRSTSSCTQSVTCSDDMLLTPGFNPIRLGHNYLKEDDKDLPDTLKKIGDSISNMNDAEKQAYKDSVTEISKYLQDDEKKLKDEAENLQKKMKESIENLQSRLDKMNDFIEKNNKFSNFYESIGKLLMDGEEECESENASKKEDTKEITKARKTTLEDLIDTLFNW